ncbi:MAG: GNAT family N-acetyltransferase [Candidatus Lokiarchaeota archaeon]|nr:GNAT family N-acetyltransferase [Candidatus Lokiarchaeota archaeon]
MQIHVATRRDDVGKLFMLRYKVFVLEQGFAESIEIDAHDNDATFLIAKEGNDVIGTLRLFKEGDHVVLGRMAVERTWRGRGIGSALVREAIPLARQLGGTRVVAHAQARALGFYIKAGFIPHGAEFDEEGVPHQLVCMKLP